MHRAGSADAFLKVSYPMNFQLQALALKRVHIGRRDKRFLIYATLYPAIGERAAPSLSLCLPP